MAEAVGISHLFPIAPIVMFLSMFLMVLLLPGFWKTRIVALVSIIGWIFIGNLSCFLGMIYWRGHTNDAPVWASILAVLGTTHSCGLYTSFACFAHFIWQRLQPLFARQLYDTRRRDNMIHLFLTLILPVLWAPLSLLACDYRYTLIEDFGPNTFTRRDWAGLVSRMPSILGLDIVGIFSALTLVRYWRAKREGLEPDSLNYRPSGRTRKLLLMAGTNCVYAAYVVYGQIDFWRSVSDGSQWEPTQSLAEKITSLQSVLTVTRTDLATSYDLASGSTGTAIFQPFLGLYVFAWFGCGAEARKAYGDGLLDFGRLIGVTGTLSFSWFAIALRKAKPHQGLLYPLPLIPPSALQLTPYIPSLPREHAPQLPADPMMHPSNPVGSVIDNKRRAPPKDPVRRLSSHKPPFVPLDPTNRAVHTIASAPNPPACRLSYHKPVFRPLDPANPTPNTRLQEEFAPRSQARRLSYHKPPFRPFVPVDVNTRGAISDVLGTPIPLVNVQSGPESGGATGLPAAGTVNALLPPFPTSSASMAPPPPPSRPPTYLAPSPLSSPSTSTAPESLSSDRTPTPAPPYQDLNTFLGRTTSTLVMRSDIGSSYRRDPIHQI